MAGVDILIPTCNRLESLLYTLSGVAAQSYTDLRVIIADQSNYPVSESMVIQALFRIIHIRGGEVEYYHRENVWGIAEQRQFLLDHAKSEFILYLDDDVYMEPWVVQKLADEIKKEGIAFVGAFPAGLSYINDERPSQEKIEYWNGPVQPEVVDPGTPAWERWQLHRAANLYHIGQRLPLNETRLYKVAWVASCILYNRNRLQEIGGFNFWKRLPRFHSGEEVLVQNLLMRRWGGCSIVPSGTYYSEVPSTVLNGAGRVDGHALELLPEMIARYAPNEEVKVDINGNQKGEVG